METVFEKSLSEVDFEFVMWSVSGLILLRWGNFMAYTAAHLKGVTDMFWPQLQAAFMLSIFILTVNGGKWWCYAYICLYMYTSAAPPIINAVGSFTMHWFMIVLIIKKYYYPREYLSL